MTYIPDAMRQFVIARAKGRCEYCLIPNQDLMVPHELDHITAEKHRGVTEEHNLCLACVKCNRNKGSDLASYDPLTGELARLFDPRQQRWIEHFALKDARIEPLTPEGRVTEFLLKFNTPERLRYRKLLIRLGEFPPPEATG
jgi:hypothetical protein